MFSEASGSLSSSYSMILPTQRSLLAEQLEVSVLGQNGGRGLHTDSHTGHPHLHAASQSM